MICSFCKASLDDQSCFCIYCGKDLRTNGANFTNPESSFGSFPSAQGNVLAACPHCKSILRPGASFCSACGKSPFSPSLSKEKEPCYIGSVSESETDGQSQKELSSAAGLSEVPLEASCCAPLSSSEKAEDGSMPTSDVSTPKKPFSIRRFFSSSSEQKKTVTLQTKNVFTATGAFALLLISVMIGGFSLGAYTSPENRFSRAVQEKNYAKAASIYLNHAESKKFHAVAKSLITPEAEAALSTYNIVWD